MNQFQSYSDRAKSILIEYGPHLLFALALLIFGWWAIKLIVRGVRKALEKSKVDVSLQRFFLSLLDASLKVLLLISVASMVGIATTSFVAIVGAAGLAVGLALQGSLANFAGGVLILLFKPFKVGDVIDAQGHVGSVHSIQVFHTVLKTADNKTIIIPNGALSNGSITNFSAEPTRRIEMVFGIGYDDDLRKAKEVLFRLIKEDPRILKDPEPQVILKELADSSVNLAVRVWCHSGDYWGIYFDFQEKVKLTFDAEGISIPYPQMDVHLQKQA